MKNRGVRRHHQDRMKQRVKNRFINIYRDTYYKNLPEDELKEAIACQAVNRKKCSCYMCGNPRKYFNEKTIQELKKEQKDREDYKY